MCNRRSTQQQIQFLTLKPTNQRRRDEKFEKLTDPDEKFKEIDEPRWRFEERSSNRYPNRDVLELQIAKGAPQIDE